jgi:hypothetical protein
MWELLYIMSAHPCTQSVPSNGILFGFSTFARCYLQVSSGLQYYQTQDTDLHGTVCLKLWVEYYILFYTLLPGGDEVSRESHDSQLLLVVVKVMV